jgi:hypothetical protein
MTSGFADDYRRRAAVAAFTRIALLGGVAIAGYGIANIPNPLLKSFLSLWYMVFLVSVIWQVLQHSFAMHDAQPLLGPVVAGGAATAATAVTLVQGPATMEAGFWIVSTLFGLVSHLVLCTIEYVRLRRSGEAWDAAEA